MKFSLPLAFGSLGWIGATGFVAVFGFGASVATAWLICGCLTLLFGLAFLYLAWEFRRATVVVAEIARRRLRPRLARAPRGVRIFDQIDPEQRLRISGRSNARQLAEGRPARREATVSIP